MKGLIFPEVEDQAPCVWQRSFLLCKSFFWAQRIFFMLIFNSFSYPPSSPSAHSLSTTSTTKVVKVHLQMNQSFMARATEKSLLRHVNNHD